MKYPVRLSNRAAKDLDRLNRETQQLVFRRLEQLSEVPFDPSFIRPPEEHKPSEKPYRRLEDNLHRETGEFHH